MPFVWRKILCGLAVLAALLGVERAAVRSGGRGRNVWPFCAYLIASLLLSPMVELHHLVLAVPTVFLLVVKAFFDSAWSVRPAILGLGAFVVCLQVAVRCDETKLLHFVALGILLILLCLAMRRPGDVQT